MARSSTRTAALLIGGSCLLPLAARAGNDDAILIGGHAALTAGAVTATIADGSAAWYNPAGIARAERQRLDINASAYGFSRSSARGLFTLPDGTRSDASVVDWQLIPSALSYVRELGSSSAVSFGIFIPTTTDGDLRTSVMQPDGRQWSVGVDTVRNEYDYVLSAGTAVTRQLRLGIALHGIYLSSENLMTIGVGTPGDPSASFLNLSNHRTVGDYGARLGLGVQWAPLASLELGLALQSPTLTAFRRIRQTELNSTFTGSTQQGSYVSNDTDEFDGVWELSTPLSVRVGCAYTVGPVQYLVDGTLSSPLDTSEIDRKLSGNLRIASLLTWSETLAFGLGLFTDLNGARQPDANFVGVAGGVRLSSDFHLLEGARTLTFLTTLAGRYAYGWGETTGIRFAENAQSARIAEDSAELRIHELAFNLGGGVTF